MLQYSCNLLQKLEGVNGLKKIFGLFVVVMCFVLLIPETGWAYDGNEEIVDPQELGYDLGESVQVEGVLSPPEAVFEPFCIVCGGVRYEVATISGPTTVKKFVRYLTGSWAKANSYTWSKSQSASSTTDANVGITATGISAQLGVSNTVTTSYSVAITIPASSASFSKLAFYSKYNKRYVRVKSYISGVYSSTKYTNHYAPHKDTYLQVVYQ